MAEGERDAKEKKEEKEKTRKEEKNSRLVSAQILLQTNNRSENHCCTESYHTTLLSLSLSRHTSNNRYRRASVSALVENQKGREGIEWRKEQNSSCDRVKREGTNGKTFTGIWLVLLHVWTIRGSSVKGFYEDRICLLLLPIEFLFREDFSRLFVDRKESIRTVFRFDRVINLCDNGIDVSIPNVQNHCLSAS